MFQLPDATGSKPPVVLTVAGFDPSSGAGVTADLQVFAAHGLFGTACITALTVQSTRGVRSMAPVAESLLSDTLRELTEDLPPVGIKIGMLATGALVRSVAAALRGLRQDRGRPWVVLDPVIRSSSGHALLDQEGVGILREELLPLVDCVTPNRAELHVFTAHKRAAGRLAGTELRDELVAEALALLQISGCGGVVVTGGDEATPDDLVLAPGRDPVWLRGEHIETSGTHGTGCAYSSALLSRFVLGEDPVQAATSAKRFVEGALRTAPGLGHGRGPLNLLWQTSSIPTRD